jgi:DNA-binding MarR family transcriptional regulator
MVRRRATAGTGEAARPRWLDADEQRAWRSLIGVVLRLPGALESQLQREVELGHFPYWIMALLSEAPGRSLRLSELADRAGSSLSRLSHVVTRLEEEGLVERQACAEDARATLAVLTAAGLARVVEAAPGHVAEVRARVFDGLEPGDVADLARICDRILERLDHREPGGC